MSPAPSCGGGVPRDTPTRAPGNWTPLHGTYVMGPVLHPDERLESSVPTSPAREVTMVEWQQQQPAQAQPPMAPAYVHPVHHHPARPLKEEVLRAMRQAAQVHGQWSFFVSDIEGMLQRLLPTSYQREMLGEVIRLLVEDGQGSLGDGNTTFHLERQQQQSPQRLVVPPGFRGAGAPPSKRAMLLVDGGYYEAIQWGVLDKFGTGYVVDVRRLVRRLEEIYDCQFVRRHYVQGTENGTLSSFHKMLTSPENKGPGFTVDIHKMKEQSIRRGGTVSSASEFGKATVMVEQGVDVAIAMEILRTTMKASYDSLVVITGDADLEPAFRVATEENRERELLKEKVQELYVLGGQKMSHELFSYTRGLRGNPVVFLETIMKECVVKKEELEKSLLAGDLSSLACLPVPEPRPSKPLSRGITPVSSWSDMRSLARSSASDTGSEEGTVSGRGVMVRWCSYGATCKFLACPDENMAHFKKYGHMCPDDQSCPFMLDYATHRRSEKGKVHFGLWRHSCPKGANCNFVEHPELHKKHMEKFTHDCYDECPPTPSGMTMTPSHSHSHLAGLVKPANTMSPTSRLAHLWGTPAEAREEADDDCGMPLVLLKDMANLLLDGEHHHEHPEPFMGAMGGRAAPMMSVTGGGAAIAPPSTLQAMRAFAGGSMVMPSKEHQLVFTQAA